MRNYIKIGVAGPVGAGKTALIEKLTREMASKYSVAGLLTIFTPKKMRNF